MKHFFAWCAASSIALTSCSSLSDASRTVLEGTGGGAALGGAAGWGIGKIFGLSDAQTNRITALGTLLGGKLGNKWAKSIVKKKEAYASTEDYLNANIKQLQTRANQVADLNESLEKQIKSLRAKKSSISNASLSKLSSDLKGKSNLAAQDISTAKSALSSASGAKRSELQSRIKTLEAQRLALLKNTSALMSISRRTV